MKAGGHLNKKIAEFGRAIVSKRHQVKEDNNSPTGWAVQLGGDNGIYQPCKIFTKSYDEKNGVRVTGRNINDVRKLAYDDKHCLTDIHLIFVDAKLGQCYAQRFKELQKHVQYQGVHFPLEIPTHAGSIQYWPIDPMPTLFELDPEEVEQLAVLMSDNKNDKHQVRLF